MARDQVYTTNEGLRIYIAGDYGSESVEIYFADERGEIVMWTQDEWVDEPSLLAKIAEVIICGCLYGPDNLREQFAGKEDPESDEPWGGHPAEPILHDDEEG